MLPSVVCKAEGQWGGKDVVAFLKSSQAGFLVSLL